MNLNVHLASAEIGTRLAVRLAGFLDSIKQTAEARLILTLHLNGYGPLLKDVTK